MKITHTVEPLDSPSDWSGLERLLGGANLDVVRNTIRHLRVLKGNSATTESYCFYGGSSATTGGIEDNITWQGQS